MLAAIRETLLDEMERDERVVLLGEDVGQNGGVFRATDGALDRFGAKRVFDTPLAESAIVGASVGLSIAGLVPVAEIQFGGFTMQAYHQIVGQLARLRYRSRSRYHCPVTIRTAYGGGVRTPEHHSDSLEAPYTHAPGLSVVVPSNAADAKGLLATAVRSEDPVLVFEPIPCYRTTCEVPDGEHLVPFGHARMTREGDDVTIVTCGQLVRFAEKAADKLAKEGIGCDVIDLRTTSPLDEETILDSVENTGRLVVADESPPRCSLATDIAALAANKAFAALEAPIELVTAPHSPVPFARELEAAYLPSAASIEKAVRKVLAYR